MADLDRIHLYDHRDVVCFGGAHPVAAVTADGTTTWWLLDLDHDHDQDAAGECCRWRVPDHEHAGPLPRRVRARTWPCLAATRSGAPCRNPAPVGADRCAQHTGRPAFGEAKRREAGGHDG